MIGSTLSMAAVIVVLLGLCFAVLLSMWDWTSVPVHTTFRRVRCPRHGRPVRVEFVERVRTGFAIRTVRHCPLRAPGERCGENCVWEPKLDRDTE
jgi:hypothetical protein